MAGTWQEACRARGGAAVVDPKTGADACRFGTVAPFRYESANKGLADLWDDATEWLDTAEGKVAGALQQASDDFFEGVTTGNKIVKRIEDALPSKPTLLDILANVLGIPKWLLVVLLVFAGYAVARQAKLVPPLKGIVK